MLLFRCSSSTGHLALEMMPSNSEEGDSTQWRVKPSRLDTGAYIQGHRRKERVRLSHPHPHVECAATSGQSGHDHDHTSTSEDDLSKLLNLPEDTQSWTGFDKRVRTYRTTSSSGPLWKNVVARITIDDKTGHIMSLEHPNT